MFEQQKCIAYYIRSATGNLADLNLQRKRLDKEFVNRKVDFTDCSVEVYQDAQQSGLQPGPEYLRMCKDLENGKIQVVMVARMNRISRSIKGFHKFFDLIREHRSRFIALNENVDSIFWHSMEKSGGAQ